MAEVGTTDRERARRQAHAWVAQVAGQALEDDELHIDDFHTYWSVRAEIQTIVDRHIRRGAGQTAAELTAQKPEAEGALQALQQALERLRRARVGNAPSHREIARMTGLSNGAVSSAFAIRRPSWETLVKIVTVLGGDPSAFAELWHNAPVAPSTPIRRVVEDSSGQTVEAAKPVSARAETADWLTVLSDGWAAGVIPPAGLVWEQPPEAKNTRHGAWNQGSWRGRVPGQGVVPAPPPQVREAVAEFLRRRPGRWARVWDCTPATSATTAQRLRLFRGLDVTLRALGITVAVYACAKALGTVGGDSTTAVAPAEEVPSVPPVASGPASEPAQPTSCGHQDDEPR